MKKTVKLLAVILTVIVGACFMFACTDTAGLQTDIDKLKQEITDMRGGSASEIDGLKAEIDELKQQNAEQQEQLDKYNAFWTEKEEYSVNETMIVYYGQKEALSIELHENSQYGGVVWGGNSWLNVLPKVTSFLADILAASILQTIHVEYQSNTYFNYNTYENTYIYKKNEPGYIGTVFKCGESFFDETSLVNFVICVPGTPFPLAKFTNLTVTVVET